MALTRRDFAPTLVALRALGLGDLLAAVPAWRALVRAFPGYRRMLATASALAPIVELLGAEHIPVGELEPLPDRGITVAVNLHGCGPQSDDLLLARRPAALLAYAHPAVPETRDGPEWQPQEHEVERWCRLVRAYGIDADATDLDLDVPVARWSRRFPLAASVDANTTVIHPGAASRSRRWPAARFAAVARAERACGRTVVVTGSPSERPLALRVARAAQLPTTTVLAGRTDIAALVTVVARAGRVVCGDTGVAHVATAVRTPSVTVFGPVSPATWGPPPGRPWHVPLWSGRYGDPHDTAVDAGLLDVSAADVIGALATLPVPPHDDGRVSTGAGAGRHAS